MTEKLSLPCFINCGSGAELDNADLHIEFVEYPNGTIRVLDKRVTVIASDAVLERIVRAELDRMARERAEAVVP
jgi:hypothetical protein